jgi:hypothetical protein
MTVIEEGGTQTRNPDHAVRVQIRLGHAPHSPELTSAREVARRMLGRL